MPTRYTKHQLFIGRSIWACLCAYIVGSIIDWQIIGQISPEWAVTTLLAIVLGALGFLAANDQVERAIIWMGQTWRSGLALFIVSGLGLLALLVPYPYFQQVVTVGADLPLSGIDKANGEAVRRGMQLAIDRENQSHADSKFHYHFQLKALDDVPDGADGANAEVGKKNIEHLMQDQHVAAIVGPYNTDVAIKEIPVVNNKGDRIALVSPSTTAECLTGPKAVTQTRVQYDCDSGYLNGSDGKGAFFRLAASSSKMARVYVGCLAASVPAISGQCPDMPHRSQQLYKQPIIIDDGSVFSIGLADSIAAEWKAQSATPLAYGPVSVSQDRMESDLQSTLTDIQTKGIAPDLIVFIGSYHDSSIFQGLLSQFSNLDKADVAYSTSIMNVDASQHFLAQAVGNRSYFAVAPLISLKDNKNPNAKDFVAAYKDAYGTDPNPYSATGYDAATILIDAIKKAQVEKTPVPNPSLLEQLLGRTSDTAKDFRQAVVDKIRDGSNYDSAASATGSFAFAPDSNGDARDIKSAAVSVFRWNPQDSNSETNINGWDFQ